MNFPKIVFRIEDRVYEVDASDGPAIRNIPKDDRKHLITLLLAIKKQDEQLRTPEPSETVTITEANVSTRLGTPMQGTKPAVPALTTAKITPEAKSDIKPDIDRLFEGLAAQERSGTKRISKLQMYILLSVISSLLLFIFSIL